MHSLAVGLGARAGGLRLQRSGPPNLAWGNRGGGSYGFNYARGLAVDPTDGDVLVADTDNARLKR